MKLTQEQKKRYEYITAELTKLVNSQNHKIESFKVTPLGNGPNFLIKVTGYEPYDLENNSLVLEKSVWVEGHGFFYKKETVPPGFLFLRI